MVDIYIIYGDTLLRYVSYIFGFGCHAGMQKPSFLGLLTNIVSCKQKLPTNQNPLTQKLIKAL